MFGYGVYDVLIIAGFLGIQHFFSTRNNVYWGGVIPVIFVVWRTWVFFTENQSFLKYVLILLVGLAFLIGGWHEGRKALQKRRKQELDKMKSRDLK
ncbi:hypothetical protein MUB24_14640 [Lederbergia sp. NSJ-179]|uniref:hypothetical protein n=1 Tax=Lederbergia sp. NSJ-179 TaxID=2931402 RepID=UPI001FD0B42E|nr:hypothetical protein [Lederbergia sp. NSJ-179]MCJ7842119.1 hypothetical protein [Lederbergia sp. NSJ-179]